MADAYAVDAHHQEGEGEGGNPLPPAAADYDMHASVLGGAPVAYASTYPPSDL